MPNKKRNNKKSQASSESSTDTITQVSKDLEKLMANMERLGSNLEEMERAHEATRKRMDALEALGRYDNMNTREKDVGTRPRKQ